MKSTLILVFLLGSLHCFSQFSLQELMGYLHKTNDVVDETLSEKGFSFSGTTITSDSSKSALWVKQSDIFAIRMEPDTISLNNPGFGHLGYTDVLKHEVVFMTQRKTSYDFILAEVKNFSFKRLGSSIINSTLMTKYENKKYYLLLNKVAKDNEITYGIIIIDKQYIIGESHLE